MNRLDAMGYVPTEKGRRTNLSQVLRILMSTEDKETKTVLNNFIRRATSSRSGRGYRGEGQMMGTPPRGKTKWRMEVQAAKGCTGAAKRLIKFDAAKGKFYAGGHPTKKHTAGRVEMYA